MGESVAEFMNRQKRKVARFGREAEAAAHKAYGVAIRAGQDLRLSSPGDVMRHGVLLLQNAEDLAARTVSRAAQEAQTRVGGALQRAARNPAVRSAAIDAARGAGNVAGVVRGGVHTVQGLADGATFVGRLVDPLDRIKSAPGESAIEQLGRGAVGAGRMGADYVRKAGADPQAVVTDVTEAAKQWRKGLDPSATVSVRIRGNWRSTSAPLRWEGLLRRWSKAFRGCPTSATSRSIWRRASVRELLPT